LLATKCSSEFFRGKKKGKVRSVGLAFIARYFLGEASIINGIQLELLGDEQRTAMILSPILPPELKYVTV
jgi:hypothetical protein